MEKSTNNLPKLVQNFNVLTVEEQKTFWSTIAQNITRKDDAAIMLAFIRGMGGKHGFNAVKDRVNEVLNKYFDKKELNEIEIAGMTVTRSMQDKTTWTFNNEINQKIALIDEQIKQLNEQKQAIIEGAQAEYEAYMKNLNILRIEEGIDLEELNKRVENDMSTIPATKKVETNFKQFNIKKK